MLGRETLPRRRRIGKGESVVEVYKSPLGCICSCSSPHLRAPDPMLLVGVMLPGFRVKQGRNLLLHGRGPSAADMALGGSSLPHVGLRGHFCPPLRYQDPATARTSARRGLSAALFVLKGLGNFYCWFPRSDSVFWRNVRYLRCSVRRFLSSQVQQQMKWKTSSFLQRSTITAKPD